METGYLFPKLVQKPWSPLNTPTHYAHHHLHSHYRHHQCVSTCKCIHMHTHMHICGFWACWATHFFLSPIPQAPWLVRFLHPLPSPCPRELASVEPCLFLVPVTHLDAYLVWVGWGAQKMVLDRIKYLSGSELTGCETFRQIAWPLKPQISQQ